MKLSIKFFISLVCIAAFGCSTPELEAALKKGEEAKCKADQINEITENGMNTMILASKIGLKKELTEFQKIQSDTTVSCDSLKYAWNRFSDLVHEKSK
jgi:hypothetical protein